jgi:hypothetical protein
MGLYRISHHGAGIEGLLLFDNHPQHRNRGLFEILEVGDLLKVKSLKTGDIIEISGRRVFFNGHDRDRGWSLVQWIDDTKAGPGRSRVPEEWI